MRESSVVNFVDYRIDRLLKDSKLYQFRELFCNVTYEQFLCLKEIDLNMIKLPLQSIRKLIKLIYSIHSVNNNLPREHLNKIYYNFIPPSIPLNSLNQNNTLHTSNVPSSIIYTPTDNVLASPQQSDYKSAENHIKLIREKVLYHLDTIPEYSLMRKPISQKPFNDLCSRPSENDFNDVNNWVISKKENRQILQHKKKFIMYLNPTNQHTTSSFGRFFSTTDVLKTVANIVKKYLYNEDLYIDMCCGNNEFAPMLGIDYLCYDIAPPKYNNCTQNFVLRNWFDVSDLPEYCVIGLNPPFGSEGETALKFIHHALKFKPRLLLCIVPYCVHYKLQITDKYDLLVQDSSIVGGGSFYLPNDVSSRISPDVNVHFFLYKSKDQLPKLPGRFSTQIKSNINNSSEHPNSLKRRSKFPTFTPTKIKKTN